MEESATITLFRNDIAANSRTAKASALNAVTGPFVAVNGPTLVGKSATNNTPIATNRATFRRCNNMPGVG